MLRFNGALPVSFFDLEISLFNKLAALFRREADKSWVAADGGAAGG